MSPPRLELQRHQPLSIWGLPLASLGLEGGSLGQHFHPPAMELPGLRVAQGLDLSQKRLPVRAPTCSAWGDAGDARPQEVSFTFLVFIQADGEGMLSRK